MSVPPARMDTSRIDEIEVKLAFIDDLVDTLNRAVFRQQAQIDQLAQAVAGLRQQLRAAAPAASIDARDEIPPHY